MRLRRPDWSTGIGSLFPPKWVDRPDRERGRFRPKYGSDISLRRSGTRWYHSRTYAGNAHRGTYTGQFGSLPIVPKQDQARYDRDVSLALHGWHPYFTTMGGGRESGEGSLKVGYNCHTVNSHALGSDDSVPRHPPGGATHEFARDQASPVGLPSARPAIGDKMAIENLS